jgi:hypothetical protein
MWTWPVVNRIYTEEEKGGMLSTGLLHSQGKDRRKYTDQKENQILPKYKEIHGAVATLYMRKGFLIYGEIRKIFNHI